MHFVNKTATEVTKLQLPFIFLMSRLHFPVRFITEPSKWFINSIQSFPSSKRKSRPNSNQLKCLLIFKHQNTFTLLPYTKVFPNCLYMILYCNAVPQRKETDPSLEKGTYSTLPLLILLSIPKMCWWKHILIYTGTKRHKKKIKVCHGNVFL